MPDLGWIIIRNWGEHQSRADLRDWNWIKNRVSMLSDDDYLALPDSTALAWHRILLAYASSRCQLRANTASLSRHCSQRITIETLRRLEQAGFIEFSAAKPQRNGSETAARARREEKRREEGLSYNGETHNPVHGWWQRTGVHVPDNQQAEYLARDLGLPLDQAQRELEQLRQEAAA